MLALNISDEIKGCHEKHDIMCDKVHDDNLDQIRHQIHNHLQIQSEIELGSIPGPRAKFHELPEPYTLNPKL